jgi:uncharacterized protein
MEIETNKNEEAFLWPMKGAIWAIILILLVPVIFANEGHLTLLAVKDSENGYEGTTADLYLEVKRGTGRVFLDTFPLTKVDTQISTRFAKDIACSYLEEDCSVYDFIYTIRADSSIIAGPSAGGAITLLTVSLLRNFDVDEGISITGTINSGGIIGPVGGVREKIDAAHAKGLRKVLIPEGERYITDDSKNINAFEINIFDNRTRTRRNATVSNENKTMDLVEYGRGLGLEVVEVSDLSDVLREFSLKGLEEGNYTFDVDRGYERTMSSLALQLCNRSDELRDRVGDISDYNVSMISILNLTSRADAAFAGERYYSAASYCFGANVKLSELLFLKNNVTSKEVQENIDIIERNVERLEASIDKKEKKTVTDLEAYAVVKERLIEATDFKEEVDISNLTEDSLYDLAYSYERVYSAFSWADFFDHRGKEYDFNEKTLESSCQSKIAEAEERYNYVLLFYPILNLKGTRKEIDYAYDDLKDGNYELCLFKATKAKAESDIILSVSGVGADKVEGLLSKKIEAARKNIGKQVKKGNFPVLAYSYYEYAQELSSDDEYSALLYAEYALELSNLDIYFKETRKFIPYFDITPVVIFAFGIAVGYLLSKVKKHKPKQSLRKALPGKKR